MQTLQSVRRVKSERTSLSRTTIGPSVTTLVGFALFLSLAYLTYWFATRPQKE